ncbi:MAG: DEAD/DEAH box helicase [Promethearchaeota archaeon]|jgi:helicase
MSLTDFTGKITKESLEDTEIYKYIPDKRILRVLFENKIFELREIQKEAIKKGLFFRKSFLVCAPSGSGKTLIGEACAINNIFQKFGKSIYLVPFKALATEKYFHFKKSYARYNVKVELSIGDYDVDDSKLEKADIIVTTYEKMDSIIRNFNDKEWIYEISTIIIDEIHILGESDRGPRLESLIVRLNEFLHNPQIIGLSATIANPQFFNSWLTSLGNQTTLIISEKRPVPLHYKIEVTQNKDSTIKRIVKSVLNDKGQILIFLNKRKTAQKIAQNLKDIVKKFMEESELKVCKAVAKRLTSIKGANRDLHKVISHGIAFHHAGLLARERKAIEDNYRKRIIKIICCTTTLSAGINTPARVVILRDFKKYITSGYNIKNFSGYHENGDGFSYFKSFSSNEVFQILGRAGRPGLDSVGHGIILVKDIDEKMWVEDNYFASPHLKDIMLPQYSDLHSRLNKIYILKEQVLLRIFEEKAITIEKLKEFFEKTYFWYSISHKMKEQKIPIEQLLMIKEITPVNILKLHSNPQKVLELKAQQHEIKLTKCVNTTLAGYIKTTFGVYSCQFDIDSGIQCSCGFKNGISDNFSGDNEFAFEFCNHITSFLLFLIAFPDSNVQKYVEDVIPQSIKNQYIINYLFEKGLIVSKSDGTIKCSQFGKLIIRLYLYPSSGVMIRSKLENAKLSTFKDLIKEAYEVLKSEYKVRDYKMLEPVLEWTDEEPIDHILDRYNIMAGDLFGVRDNLERIINFIGIIASSLSTHGVDLYDKLTKVAEMAETLKIRIHYGIREELFDLVLRLNDVARVRARVLYNAGYHTTSQVKKENPYIIHQKTGLGINLCKKIIKGADRKK